MKKGYIYSLNDPITDVPRYIGWSGQVNRRYQIHCNTKEKSHKGYWIRKLKSEGLKPTLEIIDEVNIEECAFWEQHYISLYKSWNFKLVNSSFGGEGTIGYNMPSWVTQKTLDTKRRLGILSKSSIKSAKTKKESGADKVIGKIIAAKNKENGTYEVARKRMLSAKNPAKKTMKPVLQYTKIGKFVKEWESSAAVEKELGIFKENVGRACKKKFKLYRGFQWKYKSGKIKQQILPIVW